MELVYLVLRYYLQDFFKPLVWIYIVFFAGAKEGIEHGSAFGASGRSGKQVVLLFLFTWGLWFSGTVSTINPINHGKSLVPMFEK
jgi:hypothetical protein